MTLLARNEADVVDAQLAFHLHAGVDYVIATDNASSDGTTEILERYERAGHAAAPARAGRRHAPGRVGDAHGSARRHRARRRLGAPLRRGRVLVAAGRLAEGRAGDGAAAIRHRPGLLAPLPAPSRRRLVLRRAHDRPSRATRRIRARRRRSSTPTRRSPTGRTPRSRSRRETTTPRRPGSMPLRAWHPLEVLALLVPLGRPARAQGARRLAPQPRLRADPAPDPPRRGVPGGPRRCVLRDVRGRRRRARPRSRGRHARRRHAPARRAARAPRRRRDVRAPRRGAAARVSSARARPTTRRTRRRRRCSSRSTGSSAPSSACGRSRSDSARRAGRARPGSSTGSFLTVNAALAPSGSRIVIALAPPRRRGALARCVDCGLEPGRSDRRAPHRARLRSGLGGACRGLGSTRRLRDGGGVGSRTARGGSSSVRRAGREPDLAPVRERRLRATRRRRR